MSEKITERIALLLNKAESTTPEEAEALTAAAEKLMLKHMIDRATVDARRGKGAKKEEIVQVILDCTGSYRKALMWLSWNVAQAFGNIEMLKSNDNGKTIRVFLIGFESDVEQVQSLILSLQIQGVVALRSWWKEHKADYTGVRSYEQWEARSSFVEGFGQGAARRMRESRVEAVQEAGTGTELVLVERGSLVKAHMDTIQTRKARASKSHYDGTANRAGRTAGENANLGRSKGISA